MNRISLGQFLADPERVALGASSGDFTSIAISNGDAAVIINETEWIMLRQAFTICLEHPEWTNGK